jgi:hypothetical protein
MEFASLEDAFPELEKKEKRRKEKRKEGFQAYEIPATDPDRPAVKRMQEVPPISNTKEDEFLDQSAIFAKKMTVNNSLPPPRSTIKLQQASSVPEFFGAEPFSNPSEDSLALYHGNVNNSNGYMLEADFTKSFDDTGFNKSTGTPVPTPELRQRWKPMSADRIDTSFTSSSKNSQFDGLSPDDIQAMRSKIDALMARLDDLENRAEGASPQLEMLSFIMTGLFLMFALDLTVRKVSQ